MRPPDDGGRHWRPRSRWVRAACAGAVATALLGGLAGPVRAETSVSATLGSPADEFSLDLVPAEVPAGEVVFSVTNGGAEGHTLALKGGTPTSELPPGGTATLSVGTLTAGAHTFVCTIAGHEQLGMSAVLTVGAGATTTTSIAGTTTTAAAAATSTSSSIVGATTTTSSGGSPTTAATTATTTAAGGTGTTAVAAPASRLSETGLGDVGIELAAGTIALNAGYLLWSASRPARRRGRPTG